MFNSLVDRRSCLEYDTLSLIVFSKCAVHGIQSTPVCHAERFLRADEVVGPEVVDIHTGQEDGQQHDDCFRLR